MGGATTSELHTALKIATCYSGPVVWAKDAAQDVIIAARLLNPATRDEFLAELRSRYARLREEYGQQKPQLMTIDEARENRLDLFN